MKRGEEAVGGQLGMQGDRKMTVSNTVLEGMENTKEAAILSAAAEAVTWRNAAMELTERRKGQRVVIYPKELTGLHEALSTGNPNIDEEDGHPIAYAQIIQESQKFECPPLFLRADADQIVGDPTSSEKVPEWLCTAERVATGGRRRVLQDGPDTWNSDDEAEADVEADKELNMYTDEMDPKLGPKVLTQTEAARQRARGKALKGVKPPRPAAPATGSSTESDTDSNIGNSIVSSPVQSRPSTPIQEAALAPPRVQSSKEARKPLPDPSLKALLPPSSEGKSVTRSRAVADPSVQVPVIGAPLEIMKAAASPRAPADQPKGAKAPPPKKGQESPETKVSHP
jgi:hypothetical protein